MKLKNPHLPSLLSLAACCAATSCVHAQDEPEDDAPAPKMETTVAKPPAKVGRRAQPKTFQVKVGAVAGGDGSAQKPFATIQEALVGAQGGDIIVVGAGTYQGGFSLGTAYPDDAPLTIRAADGTQPVLSGMQPVAGWKAGANGVYNAEVEGRAQNLFVGAERLSLASSPKTDGTWIKVTALDAAAKTIAFSGQGLPQITKDTRIYAFSPSRKNFEFRGFQKLAVEGDKATLSFDEGNWKQVASGKYNRFVFFNAPSLITREGEYALEYLEGGRTRFHFKPRNAAQLASTQFRAGGAGIYLAAGAANVNIKGFVVTGMNGSAIGATKARKITVEDCVMYNSETGFNAKFITDLTLRRCLIAQNYWGIGLFDADHVLIEQCEVAFNDEDGIRVSGRVFDKKSQKLGATDLKFSQVYVHHHQYQGHPDNIQFFRGVGRTEFDKMLLMYGGQQMMMEQTEAMKLRDSVVLIGINRGMNLFSQGKPEVAGWDLENNTVGFNRYNPVYVGGVNNRSMANLYFNYSQPVTLPPTGLKADYDWFDSDGKRGFALEKPKKGETAAKVEVQANAGKGDPKLRNVPASMAVAFAGGGSADKLSFDADAATIFAVGDLIEINGDGIARKVQSVEGKAIIFAPALPAPPFRYSNVLNWKNNPNFQMDTRPALGSPLLKAGPEGKAVGSSLDIAAYQRGDFDGDGKRDLPPVPKELADMLGERPNRYIFPYSF